MRRTIRRDRGEDRHEDRADERDDRRDPIRAVRSGRSAAGGDDEDHSSATNERGGRRITFSVTGEHRPSVLDLQDAAFAACYSPNATLTGIQSPLLGLLSIEERLCLLPDTV
jgi:hypothetical protein